MFSGTVLLVGLLFCPVLRRWVRLFSVVKMHYDRYALTDIPKPDDDTLSICADCVGEPFLSEKIRAEGVPGLCAYCEGDDAPVFTVEKIADEVEIAFEEHFRRTPTEPSDFEYAMIKEGDLVWYRDGQPVASVIAEYTQIDGQGAEDIRSVLFDRHYDRERYEMSEEGPFDKDAHYAEAGVDDDDDLSSWHHFEVSLKTQARYFSRVAEETLRSVFQGMADHKDQNGHPAIVDAGPGEELASLYRARVFQSEERLRHALRHPDQDLGSPPPTLAIAGRMNARGISVFYGATDPLVALSEVRPPVGSRVLTGKFNIVRPLRLLDVEVLRAIDIKGSIFDRGFIERLRHAKFLGWLSERISVAVMPDDEPLEYLATQAIADYLATEADPPLDGILYPSVQGGEGKRNAVLFHKAALVKRLDVPVGTKITVELYGHSDDGATLDPWVFEEVPPPVPPPAQEETNGFPVLVPEDLTIPQEYEWRQAALQLDISSLRVREVRGVTVDSEEHTVFRQRYEKTKGEPPF